jgi:solute carrier family 25 phosphate transporter 3
LYRTAIYLAAGASAEFLADIALAPWEATKVRMQTQDNWAGTLREGLPKLYGMRAFFLIDFLYLLFYS